jgi:hypothetical protein
MVSTIFGLQDVITYAYCSIAVSIMYGIPAARLGLTWIYPGVGEQDRQITGFFISDIFTIQVVKSYSMLNLILSSVSKRLDDESFRG